MSNTCAANTSKPREQILIKTDDRKKKNGCMIGRIGRWCVCVCMCVCVGGVMEINGVRSKGAIRTMEGSKRVGGVESGEESGEPVLVCQASPEPTQRRCLIRPVNLRD